MTNREPLIDNHIIEYREVYCDFIGDIAHTRDGFCMQCGSVSHQQMP